jgi:hypothetical protein
MSTDRETISDWAEEHDVVPARYRGADEGSSLEDEAVEEAESESGVVDREVVEETVVGAELRLREFDCDVTGFDSYDGDVGSTGTGTGSADSETHFDAARFEAGYRWDEPVEVAVAVDEEWLLTKEVAERLTVESEMDEDR